MSLNPSTIAPPGWQACRQLIELAWQEDYRGQDITTQATIPAGQTGQAQLVFREPGILCGLPVVQMVLERYDSRLSLQTSVCDGQSLAKGQSAGTISGPVQTLLAAERVVLNFMQRLSGIATLTGHYVAATAGTGVKICDTRKTTPGWRELEKYGVRCGGGVNHRQGLYDAALIKDNHLASLNAANWTQALTQAVARLRQNQPQPQFIMVEVDTLDQLRSVLEIPGVDMILLDNMNLDQLRQAAHIRFQSGRKNIALEASGGITLEKIPAIAATGIDRISVGALTHSVRHLDIGLDMDTPSL